jgi:hypothetical protein
VSGGMPTDVLQRLGLEEESPNGSGPKEKEKVTQAELLLHCAAGAQLFHTPAGESYALVPVGGHRETHPIKARGFRRWLVRGFFEEHGKPPGAQALQDALGLLEARAQFDGPQRTVHVRVAEHDGAIYVDLANERWESIEITRAAGVCSQARLRPCASDANVGCCRSPPRVETVLPESCEDSSISQTRTRRAGCYF